MVNMHSLMYNQQIYSWLSIIFKPEFHSIMVVHVLQNCSPAIGHGKCRLYVLTVDMFMSRKAFLSTRSLQLLSRVSCAFICDLSCARVDKMEHICILFRAETSLHLLPHGYYWPLLPPDLWDRFWEYFFFGKCYIEGFQEHSGLQHSEVE